MDTCGVCGDEISPELAECRIDCLRCGRHFAPCCNSADPDLCVECAEECAS